jgi:8-oxo-dGTP diphosphatase
MDAPIFGRRLAGCRYVVRPSAYAVVRDEAGRVAIVRAARGWHLPGGGLDPGETAEEAVEREAREECGFSIRLSRRLGDATEIVHSPAGNAGVDKVSAFFEATVAQILPDAVPEHEVVWLGPEAAVERLSHGSHRWAVTTSSAVPYKSR